MEELYLNSGVTNVFLGYEQFEAFNTTSRTATASSLSIRHESEHRFLTSKTRHLSVGEYTR
jgi:hypothetical protein